MRRLCSTVLVMEALILLLAIPVAISVSGTDPSTAGWAGGALAAAAVVITALLRYRWAYLAGSVLQPAVVATGVVVPAMFVLGLIFAALWVIAIWLGRRAGVPTSR